MKQKITTIMCITLLALQLGALVMAEEKRAVSGNDPAPTPVIVDAENTVAGEGEVFRESMDSDGDTEEIPEEEEQSMVSDNDPEENDSDDDVDADDMDDDDVNDNDVSEEDVDDVSDNDVSEEDVSGNDVSGNDVSGNDVSDNDVSGNDVSDNDVSGDDVGDNDVSGDAPENPGVNGEAADHEGHGGSGNTVGDKNSEEVADDSDLEEKVVDPDQLKVVSLQVPRKLDFVIDPWEIGGKGSIWSKDYVFHNSGKTPVKLHLKNIKCKVRDGIFCAGEKISPNEVSGAAGKAVRLLLKLSTGDVIYVTEESRSYDIVIKAGESLTLAVSGMVNNPKAERWQDGDISLVMAYSAMVYENEETKQAVQKEAVKEKEEAKTDEVVKEKEEIKIEEAVNEKEGVKTEEAVKEKEEVKTDEAVKEKEEVKTDEAIKEKEEVKTDEAIKEKIKKEEIKKEEIKKDVIKNKEEAKEKEESVEDKGEAKAP